MTRVELRVAAADVKRWRITAALDGRTLSSWIRRVCDSAAIDGESFERLHAAVQRRNRR